MEAANAQLAAIVESSGDAIVSKDLSGIIQTWNSTAERIYGYPAEEAIGQNIGFLLPPGREEEEREILARIRRGECVDHFETVRLRKDGSPVHVSLTISPVQDRAGMIVGASHVARDISERKKFEEQMRQAQRLESLGVLAGGIAHDFNNLLTGIIGNASLISESLAGSPLTRERLQDLTVAAERAAELTRQLLAYSGKGQFVVGPVNLSDVVAEISPLVRVSIPKSVTLRLELEKDVPLIKADQSQIQQLVMSLIINGAEAIGESCSGTVLVKTGAHRMDEDYIRAAFPALQLTPGEYVYIEVRDNGCGMDEPTKSRIFDPFFTTKFTGRGLGLSAALGIVNACKGAIRVHSTPGEGSTFTVFLPVSHQSSPLLRESTKAASKGTILVVDDEEVVRKVAKSSLETHGYRVVVAGDGREAVDLFGKMPSSIALILLDLTMPLMGGQEALRHFRAVRTGVPVILSSGYSKAEAMRRFPNEGLAGFVQKPYTSVQLRETVDAVLAQEA